MLYSNLVQGPKILSILLILEKNYLLIFYEIGRKFENRKKINIYLSFVGRLGWCRFESVPDVSAPGLQDSRWRQLWMDLPS